MAICVGVGLGAFIKCVIVVLCILSFSSSKVFIAGSMTPLYLRQCVHVTVSVSTQLGL